MKKRNSFLIQNHVHREHIETQLELVTIHTIAGDAQRAISVMKALSSQLHATLAIIVQSILPESMPVPLELTALQCQPNQQYVLKATTAQGTEPTNTLNVEMELTVQRVQ